MILRFAKGLTAVFLSFVIFACSEDNPNTGQLDTDQSQDVEYLKVKPFTNRKVPLKEIPDVKDFLAAKSGGTLFSDNLLNSKSGDQVIMNEDEVLIISDTLGNENYSFQFLHTDAPPYTFYNLIVPISSNGVQLEPYVMSYQSDSEFVEHLIDSGNSSEVPFAGFTGNINIHPFEYFFPNGLDDKNDCPTHEVNGDPIICEELELLDGYNSSGGGGSISVSEYRDYSLTVNIYHIIPDGTGRIYPFTTGSNCEHNFECEVVFEYIEGGGQTSNKSTVDDCSTCAVFPSGGVGTNAAPSLYAGMLNTELDRTLNPDELTLLSSDNSLTLSLLDYLDSENSSEESKSIVYEIISLSANGVLDEFEQDYRQNMSVSEEAIFNSMSQLKQKMYLMNGQKATWAAENLYPNSSYNGRGDAFRHAYFNALNVLLLGFSLAKDLADAHENNPLDYSMEYKEVQMDLFNNEVGRTKSNWFSDGYQSLTESIQDAMANGELRYLTPLQGGGASGRATLTTQLVPTY